MSNDFSTDDCVDEGICLDSTGSTERALKPKVNTGIALCTNIVYFNVLMWLAARTG